eukprot:4231725-Pleurochrysis_carterae.AAC.3
MEMTRSRRLSTSTFVFALMRADLGCHPRASSMLEPSAMRIRRTGQRDLFKEEMLSTALTNRDRR